MKVPTQQEMDFATALRRKSQRDSAELRAAAVERELARIVGIIGAKEIADRLGLEDETLIHHWLGRRNGRRPPIELLDVCLDLDTTDGLIAAICRDRYETPERLNHLSLEAEVCLLRKALSEFGAVGEQKLRAIALAKPEGKP